MDLFGTAGIRGHSVDRVTPELALAVGRAAGRDADTVVLARDGRETGPALAAAMEAGLESAGATVLRAGQLPTPALAFASRGRRGVMLTASHNPPQDNGIKLFSDGVEYDREAEQTIEERVGIHASKALVSKPEAGTSGVVDDPAAPWDEWGDARELDAIDAYREAVREYATGFGASPDGMRIAVDCGNGMASVATPQVLRAIGARVTTLNANVDGHFPGRPSKPTPETLSDLREFVASGASERPRRGGGEAVDGEGDFAFGIGHDGDADRIVIVNADGDIVHEDTIIAIVASHYVAASEAADPVVVTTPNASGRIDERVDAAGGRVERVRLGALHEGIAAALRDGSDDTEVVFAAEPWKHVHTGFGGWIDGVTSAAVITRLVAEAGGVDPLVEPVTELPYRKVSVDCPDPLKVKAMNRMAVVLPELFPDASVDTEHGVRVELPDGSWVLVRPSGTEPYVRVYAESEAVDALVDEVTDALTASIAELE